VENFNHKNRPFGKVFVVEEKTNPSTDYYILPALAACEERVIKVQFDQCPEAAELEGATVIFVRYVPQQWVRLIERVRPRLQRLIYFMDDDLLDTQAQKELPWRYRLKLMKLAARRKAWLQKQAIELWVSTPYLANKYEGWRPFVVSPLPKPQAPELSCRFFYHGSTSHMAEILWLRGLVESILNREEQLSFEIMGDNKVYRLYRDLLRVNIVHPMSWSAYQAFLSIPGRHIGLVPMLTNPFNSARSYVKFFDITCCGAVGIYPRDSIYAEVVRDGIDGLLVPQETQAWEEAVLTLAGDEQRRQDMLKSARARIADM